MKVQQSPFVKRCHKCGAAWNGFGQPRPRQICQGCGAYLHSCTNCHHFDKTVTNSCKLSHTTFVGSRDALNYCEDYRMVNAQLKAIEARTERARNVWDDLFRK